MRKSTNELGCVVWTASALWWSACCFCLWSDDVFCILILPSFLPVYYESLHYMHITTPASAFVVVLRSSTGTRARAMVRSDRPTAGKRVLEFSPLPEHLAERKMKCHADDSRCQNYSETLLYNTSKSSGWHCRMVARTSSPKRVFEKPFYYYFWLILYIIFSQILFSVLYKPQRL